MPGHLGAKLKLDILFWFYKDFEICRERLEQLRGLNKDIKIFALYGGALEEEQGARNSLADIVDDFYYFPHEKAPDWKWKHGDQLIVDWFSSRGKDLDWETIFVLQWDMLVLSPLEEIFSDLEPGQIVLSGYRPISEIVEWWPWAKPPLSSDLDKFKAYLKVELGYQEDLYACLFVIACLPRDFLYNYSELSNPEIGFLEYKLPTMANYFKTPVFSSTQTTPWWASDPLTADAPESEKVINAVGIEISESVIFSELEKQNGKRIFHPFYGKYSSHRTDSTNSRYAELISHANQLYELSDHEKAIRVFDEAVEYAVHHKLPQRIVCTQRSSYKDYYVISMDAPAVAYFPVSKCACSTIKAWLMSVDHTRRTAPGLHQALAVDDHPHDYWGYDADLDLGKYQHHRKFAVVRDPLERFVSFYTNFLDRISRGWFHEDNSCDSYINKTTDINDFVDYFCDRPIHHYYILQHTMPQHVSLREVFPSLDEIFTTDELGKAKEFLEDTFEMALPALRQNASHSKHKTTTAVELNRASVEKLMHYYAQDYKLLENYFDPLEAADRFAR